MSARSTSTGRLALLALSAAILLGAAAAFLPRDGVDAQNRDFFGHWYAKVGDYAVCPAQNEEQAAAGFYSRTDATSITLYLRSWGIRDCDAGNVVARDVQNVLGGYYGGRWYLELRDAAGSGGSLIDGARINLPDGFAGRRTDGAFNRRDQAGDGDWPTSQNAGAYDYGGVSVLPVEVSFTLPDDYRGSAFLHAGIYFNEGIYINEQDERNNVWENFSFEFSPMAVTLAQQPSNPIPSVSDGSDGDQSGAGGGAADSPVCLQFAGEGLQGLQNRYFARLPKGGPDARIAAIPQADRLSQQQRECAQRYQNEAHPGLSWTDRATCAIHALVSLRRTGERQERQDGIYVQFQRTATQSCRHVQTPVMDDGSTPPSDLIPPSPPRTEITEPIAAYYWICWEDCA